MNDHKSYISFFIVLFCIVLHSKSYRQLVKHFQQAQCLQGQNCILTFSARQMFDVQSYVFQISYMQITDKGMCNLCASQGDNACKKVKSKSVMIML